MAQDEACSLLLSGGGLADRLVTTILVVWAQGIEPGDARAGSERPPLTAALYGRAAVALRTWLGDPHLDVAVDMIDSTDPAELTRGPDGIRARLPFTWLTDIWVRDLSVVLGRFSVGLVESGDERQRVLTADPDVRDFRPVTISIDT